MFEEQIRSVFVPECFDLGLMMHVQYERVDEGAKVPENSRIWYGF